MKLEEAIDFFLVHLKVERALSKHTLCAYGTDLKIFAQFFHEHYGADETTPVSALTSEQLRQFLYRESVAGLSVTTIARRLASLRSLFQYLIAENILHENPAESLRAPQKKARLPLNAEHHEMMLLLDAPNTGKLRGLRDRAILSLFYAAGLRVSELSELLLGRYDARRGRVQVIGKGNKERVVPIGELTQSHLSAYLDARKNGMSSYLFCGPSGQQLTRQAIWKLVKKYCQLAGVSTKVHPHSLRHAFATELIAGGADLRSVQMMLGHSSITTTEIYTHLDLGQIQQAHEKRHPRG